MSQKTPISLMNELAKGNNLSTEYSVVEESGPAHKKTFKVQLTLGDIGKWEATANNIKLAKHKAAEKGLEKCGLCLPDKKPPQRSVNLTPTVELNGLAMKLGKATQYRDLPPKPLPNHQGVGSYMGYQGAGYGGGQIGYGVPQQHRQFHNQYNVNMYQRGPPRIIRVSLTVGDEEFIGEGRDKQKARHEAAHKAMKVLRKELLLQMASEDNKTAEMKEEKNEEQVEKLETADKEETNESEEKSEISQVFEIATRMKLMVDFQDLENVGPAHMKKFRVRATVGQMQTEGGGNRKKDAKKDAAVKMLAELKKLPEPPAPGPDRKKNNLQYQRRGLLYNAKKVKPKTDIDPSLNAISILGQILQRRHEPAPVYSMVEERGHLTKKEFVLKVTVGSHEANGVGPNKKVAKKNAAEAMLKQLGFRPTEAEIAAQSGKPNESESADGNNSCGSPPTILGRQLKPGLLPMNPEMAKQLGYSTIVAPIAQGKEATSELPPHVPLIGGLNRAPGAPISNAAAKPLTSFQKLLTLSEVHGFRVQYTDYPKDNQGSPEFLSVVNVSCVPPLTCYGSGVTIEVAREEAASNALKPLMNLNIEHDAEHVNGTSMMMKSELQQDMGDIKNE